MNIWIGKIGGLVRHRGVKGLPCIVIDWPSAVSSFLCSYDCFQVRDCVISPASYTSLPLPSILQIGDEDIGKYQTIRTILRMATCGNIEEFSLELGDWTQYTERLSQNFIANDVTNEIKQRAILLSVCGSATYNLIRSLVAPEKPSGKTYEQLCTLVQEYHNPKPSVIVQQFKFNSLYQKAGQPVSACVAELRNKVEQCDFGATLEDMLRDRLVVGISEEQIQRRLLSEKSLTFR